MSLDTSTPVLSPIENEIPAYRAVSTLAVFSLLLGAASVFTFAYGGLAILGVLAIVTGLLALRGIKKYPDIMTGAQLARLGIALGLVFIVSATTFDFVRRGRVKSSASRFAEGYAKVLETGDLAKSVWYRLPPSNRNAKGPQETLRDLTANDDPMSEEMYMGPIKSLHSRIKDKGHLHLVDLEDYGYLGVTPYALALVEVHGKDEAGKEDDEFALLEVRSAEGSGFNWYVHQLVYPYKPESYQPAPDPVDDGHGHSH